MLNIAVIGAGRIGSLHAATVAAHPGARLTWVADAMEGAARRAAEPHGARSTTDVEELLSADDVDAVVIASPTDHHIPHLLAAARHGKASLCEKPVAMAMTDVDAVRAELDAIRTPVMFGFNRRFDPAMAAAAQALADGRLGRLEQVTVVSRDSVAPPAAYVKVSGGIFRDMSIHDLDMMRWFMGDVEQVTAFGQSFNPEIRALGDYDAAVIVLRGPGGVVGTVINDRHCASGYDQRLELMGDRGSATVDNVRSNPVRFHSDTSTENQLPYLASFLERYADAYRLELDHFIRCVESHAEPVPGLQDAIEALQLAEAATISAREGKTVDLRA